LIRMLENINYNTGTIKRNIISGFMDWWDKEFSKYAKVWEPLLFYHEGNESATRDNDIYDEVVVTNFTIEKAIILDKQQFDFKDEPGIYGDNLRKMFSKIKYEIASSDDDAVKKVITALNKGG
jgi:hypothetical protein